MDGLGEGIGDYIDELGYMMGTSNGVTKVPLSHINDSKLHYSTVAPVTVTDGEYQNALDYGSMAWITSGCIVTTVILFLLIFVIHGIVKRRTPQIPPDDDCDIPFEKII